MSDEYRQAGRTTKMLERVIRHVRDGGENACAVIVVVARYHADDIRRMLNNMLLDDELHITRGIKYVTIYDKFITIRPDGIGVCGESKSNIFVDHYALETLVNVCACKRDVFLARAAEEDQKIEWLQRAQLKERMERKGEDGKAG